MCVLRNTSSFWWNFRYWQPASNENFVKTTFPFQRIKRYKPMQVVASSPLDSRDSKWKPSRQRAQWPKMLHDRQFGRHSVKRDQLCRHSPGCTRDVVVMTTSGITNDDKVVTITFEFQFKCDDHHIILENSELKTRRSILQRFFHIQLQYHKSIYKAVKTNQRDAKSKSDQHL